MSAATLFTEAPAAVTERAARGRVDVWQVALEPGEAHAALRTLSGPERVHAARLRVGADAWVASRAALRRVLARYLGVAPQEVELERGANGKPHLAPGAAPDLRFNLSHSGGVALVAVRLGHEVGVDVEEVRPGVDGVAIARDVFTPAEREALPAPSAGEPPEAFLRSWTRREALAKATGRGIALPIVPGADGSHTVEDLDGIPGFAAALASEGDGWSVRRMDEDGSRPQAPFENTPGRAALSKGA